MKIISTIIPSEVDYGFGKETLNEKRYIIIDEETGEVLDDAQGYGFKTFQKAIKCWGWKHAKNHNPHPSKKKPELTDEELDNLFFQEKVKMQNKKRIKSEVNSAK
ncbi:MAG: hypothetical protein MJ063_00745 [Lachnospiraceae bacterium]|nr:hypothetical protein [Lachnospiraceae bacterium]